MSKEDLVFRIFSLGSLRRISPILHENNEMDNESANLQSLGLLDYALRKSHLVIAESPTNYSFPINILEINGEYQ
jgi:hypothetical protein